MSRRWTLPIYKIVVLGDGAVGKTCLTTRLCLQSFVDTYDPTLEDSYRKQCVIDQQSCILEVLDTAGQEEYTALREQWIRDGDVYLLVYSISSRSTFEGIRKFYQQILQVKRWSDHVDLPIVLVANKCDLPTQRIVSTQEGEAMARELKIGFLETSAKEGLNVEKAFYESVRRYRRKHEEENHADGTERKNSKSNNPKSGGKWKGRITRMFGSSGKHSD
ncbi:hypothetical protein TruAng_005767 [Truncatella angustata]|nr:hypothetical protein TruAng_005767 [Truncatella angustata]